MKRLTIIIISIALLLTTTGCRKKMNVSGGKAFNSELPFYVYALTYDNGFSEYIGQTPNPAPIKIPECLWWYIVPFERYLDTDIRDEIRIKKIPGLKIQHSDINHLSELPDIKYLSLEMTELTDEDLVHIVWPKSLEGLNLQDTKITDAGLQYLKNLENLQMLNISSTRISDE